MTLTGVRMRGLIAGILFLGGTITAGAQPAQSCPDALPSRLVVGDYGRVTPGEANRVRALPSTNGELIGSIPGEGIFVVYDGPVCADGFAWWRVHYDGLIGWTAEAGVDYWLEPLPADIQMPAVPVTVDFEGVRLIYDSALASSTVGQILPIEETAFYYPERRRITLENWSGGGDFPVNITIYPVEDYVANEDLVGEPLAVLGTILGSGQVPADGRLPEVVPVMAAQFLQALPELVPFSNGTGLRYLAAYTQNVGVVLRSTVRYYFQGLTDDGQYFIHAVLPLTISIFPERVDDARFTEISDNFPEYLAEVIAELEAAPPDVFLPTLAAVDAMMASLRVGPQITPPDRSFQRIDYGGVSFHLDFTLASDARGRFTTDDPNMGPQPAPQHILFDFDLVVERGAWNELRIYPLEEFESFTGVSLDPLLNQLTNRGAGPTAPDGLPVVNASRLMAAQTIYLNMRGGGGIRYVGYFAQQPGFIQPVYVYHGITNSRQFYVQAVFSLASPLLTGEALAPYFTMDSETFMAQYDEYFGAALALLEAAGPDDFAPSLNVLDGLIASLRIDAD